MKNLIYTLLVFCASFEALANNKVLSAKEFGSQLSSLSTIERRLIRMEKHIQFIEGHLLLSGIKSEKRSAQITEANRCYKTCHNMPRGKDQVEARTFCFEKCDELKPVDYIEGC